MKDMIYIMETTCKKDLKLIGCVYCLLFAVQLGAGMRQETLLLHNYVFLILMDGAAFLAIAHIHKRRFQQLASDGALTRILLLPVKRNTVLNSELLFSLATFAGVIGIQNLLWIIQYLQFHPTLIPYENQFMVYTLSHHLSNIILPYTWFGWMQLLSMLLALSFVSCFHRIASAVKERQGRSFVCLIFVVLCILLQTIAYPNISIFVYLGMTLFSYSQMKFLMGVYRRRRKV